MIIKGKSSTGRGLGKYLLQDKNDRVQEWGIRGDIHRDLTETLNDWRSDSLGTTCTKPLYHAQLNPDRALSRKEWDKAIAIFEKEMGFQNQPRAIVLHEYKGREHLHLVYSRMKENGRAIPDSWNYAHHEKAARAIERQLGLEKTQGVFIDREGQRIERTPDHAAIQQGERLNKDPHQIKAEISALYQKTAQDGTAFVNALQNQGYTLAQGNSHNYVIIDEHGGVHSLSRTAKVKVAELRETLNEYPMQNLSSVEQVRENIEVSKSLKHESKDQSVDIELDPHEAKMQALKEIYRRYDDKYSQEQEQELDEDIGLGLDLFRR